MLSDLEYVDVITILDDSVLSIQHILLCLGVEASQYGMHFALSKCKVLIQDCEELVRGHCILIPTNLSYFG